MVDRYTVGKIVRDYKDRYIDRPIGECLIGWMDRQRGR